MSSIWKLFEMSGTLIDPEDIIVGDVVAILLEGDYSFNTQIIDSYLVKNLQKGPDVHYRLVRRESGLPKTPGSIVLYTPMMIMYALNTRGEWAQLHNALNGQTPTLERDLETVLFGYYLTPGTSNVKHS